MSQQNLTASIFSKMAKLLWIPLISLLLAWSVTLLPFYSRLDLWLFDAQQQFSAKERYFQDALIIDIDEESVQKLEPYFGSWPYQRDTYGLVLDYLGEKGARVVVFDMLFPDARKGDSVFQNAIARNKNVILAASAFNGAETLNKANLTHISALEWQAQGALPALNWGAAVFPNPAFAGSAEGKARVGLVSVVADTDGVLRRLPLLYNIDGHYLPSLVLAANFPSGKLPDVTFKSGTGMLHVGNDDWPVDHQGAVQLNYPSNANSVLVMRFSRLAGAVLGLPGQALDAHLFKDKTIFVGSTAYFTDRVNTPYGLMSGIHMLAIVNQALKNNLVLKQPQWGWNALLVLMALSPSLIIRARSKKSAIFVGTVILGAVAAIYILNFALLARYQQQSMLFFPLLVVFLAYLLETISGLKTANKMQTAELHNLTHQDGLTGLPNRFALQQHLDHTINLSSQGKQSAFAVMLIDLDRFKIINDTLGNLVGDKLLIEVAGRLKGCVRTGDIVARLGGDEFVVVVHDVRLENDIEKLAKKIVHTLSQTYLVAGHELHTSPSIGVSFYPVDAESVDVLMRNADSAMYHAKSLGRNNYQLFTNEMNQVATERLELENSLHQALERNELFLNYQPQIDSHTGYVVGVEALMRWMHPEKGLVMPDQFIPIAEETGLILPMGEWALRTACQQFRSWQLAGMSHIKLMAVNLSALQFQRGDLPTLVATVLRETGMDAKNLELEITESAAMKNPKQTIEILNTLSEMGVRLAIDDFGTGHSSLNYLKLFPIHCLKLDGSFVRGIGSDSNDAAICDASIKLAHNLGLEVVAEGVETVGQFEYLKELDCGKIQGYYFSKPLSSEDAGAFVRQNNTL